MGKSLTKGYAVSVGKIDLRPENPLLPLLLKIVVVSNDSNSLIFPIWLPIRDT